jgi:hypothetical protein
MTETDLNSNDKLQLKADIKISMLLGLLFSLAIVVLIGLILGVMFIFGQRPSDGFVIRFLYIIGFSFLPLLAVSWTNILKYIDLKKGKKLIFKTVDFEIKNKKDKAYILIQGNNKLKIKIDKELVSFINPSQTLTIEISNLAKSLLFISHGNDNLLDKQNNDENK